MSGQLRPGAILDDRYTLLRRLGAGSTGAVWQAEDGHGGLVACKILHPQLSDDQQVVQQMLREARVLAQLTHPNITRPIDFRTDGPFVYLAMEFVDGDPLHEVIGARAELGRNFSGSEVQQLFGQLCDGVAHAHSKYIVHRDLKPHNVMVVRGAEVPQIKVLDFGLARLLEGSIFEATTFGRALGSLFYMSPEQTRGEPATIRSDVFALGAILYELVTLHRTWARDNRGRPVPAFSQSVPGASNNLADVFDRLARGPRPKARDLRLEVSSRLDALIRRALDIEPKSRPSSVGELREEAMAGLEGLEPGEVVWAPATGPITTAGSLAFGPTIVDDAELSKSTDPAPGELVGDGLEGAGPTTAASPSPAFMHSLDSSSGEPVATTSDYIASPGGPSTTATQESAAPSFDDFAAAGDGSGSFDSPTVDVHSAAAEAVASAQDDRLSEPELPSAIRTSGPVDDNRPTQNVRPASTTALVASGSPAVDVHLRPGQRVTTGESAAATEPGELYESVSAVVQPIPTDIRLAALPHPSRSADTPIKPRRPAVERRARVARAEARADADAPKPSASNVSPNHPEIGRSAIAIVGSMIVVGALVVAFLANWSSPRSPGRTSVPGVVEVVDEATPTLAPDVRARLHLLLQRLDAYPNDADLRSRLKEALVGEAAKLRPGRRRREILRLTQRDTTVENDAALRAAAELLMSERQ